MTVRVGDPESVSWTPTTTTFTKTRTRGYRRLRDEAPLYRNEERNFWAVSRHHDAARLPGQHGVVECLWVIPDPPSRTSEAYRVMSMLAMDDPAHLWMRTLSASPHGGSVNPSRRCSNMPAFT